MRITTEEEIINVKNELKKMDSDKSYHHKENYEALTNKLRLLKIREALINQISNNNYKYHITINFIPTVNKHIREETIKTLLKRLRCDLFGRNRNKDHLKGFIISEFTKKDLLHYHLLIEDHPIFYSGTNINKNMSDLIDKKAKGLKFKIGDKYSKNSLFMKDIKVEEKGETVVKKGILVQDYYSGNLEHYLTKNLESNPEDTSFVRSLSYEGYSNLESCSST